MFHSAIAPARSRKGPVTELRPHPAICDKPKAPIALASLCMSSDMFSGTVTLDHFCTETASSPNGAAISSREPAPRKEVVSFVTPDPILPRLEARSSGTLRLDHFLSESASTPKLPAILSMDEAPTKEKVLSKEPNAMEPNAPFMAPSPRPIFSQDILPSSLSALAMSPRLFDTISMLVAAPMASRPPPLNAPNNVKVIPNSVRATPKPTIPLATAFQDNAPTTDKASAISPNACANISILMAGRSVSKPPAEKYPSKPRTNPISVNATPIPTRPLAMAFQDNAPTTVNALPILPRENDKRTREAAVPREVKAPPPNVPNKPTTNAISPKARPIPTSPLVMVSHERLPINSSALPIFFRDSVNSNIEAAPPRVEAFLSICPKI